MFSFHRACERADTISVPDKSTHIFNSYSTWKKGKGKKKRGQLTGYSVDSLSITHLEYARPIRPANAPSAAVEPVPGLEEGLCDPGREELSGMPMTGS